MPYLMAWYLWLVLAVVADLCFASIVGQLLKAATE